MLLNLISPSRLRLIIVFLAAVLPFCGGLRNEIFWDDTQLLSIRLQPENCSGLGDVWSQPYWGTNLGPADTYRPFSLSLIYLEHRLFGDRYALYRVVSLALHGINSLLVYAFISRLAGKAVGWWSSLLFALHPVHTEAVVMIYGQLELLAFLFVMLAILAWLRVIDTSQSPGHDSKPASKSGPMSLAMGCAALAYCSKESALMLPSLMMLTRLCYGGAIGSGRHVLARVSNGLWREAAIGLVAIPYLILRFRALGALAPAAENTVSANYDLQQRIYAVIVAIGHGLRLCTIPQGQTLYYGHLRDSVYGMPRNEILWLAIAAVCLWMIVSDIGRRRVAFGMGWFLLAILPVANIVPSGVLVAERTLYLPSLGIFFMAGSYASYLLESQPAHARRNRRILMAIGVVFMIASMRVTDRLGSAETHWASTARFYPRSPLAQLENGRLTLERFRNGGPNVNLADLDRAEISFRKAFELNPALTEALLGQGYVAKFRGDRPGLETLYRTLQEKNPQATKELAELRKLLESP